MAQITVEGRKVTVSDNFLSMSREEQDKAVDEIAASMGPKASAVGSSAPPEAPYTWGGAANAVGGGLMQAAASIPGAIGDVPYLISEGANWVLGQTTGRLDNYLSRGTAEAKSREQVRGEQMATRQWIAEETGIPTLPQPWEVINSQKVLGWMEPVLGKPYEPQNTGEKYIQTVTSFAPAAIAPGSALQRGAQVAIPGGASEFLGQSLEGTGYEGAGRVVGAIAGGGATALMSRKGVPERMVSQAMGALDDATLTAAGRLMIDADRMGVPLTWPEAVQHASNGATRLTDLQRVVENSTGGGPAMRQFYADRPDQVDAAARQQFDQIAPNPMMPEQLGPRVQQAADADISNVNRTINAQTRPMYQAAEAQTIPANSPALRNPAFIQAVTELRNNPVLGPRFANLPDNSIGVIDAAQKLMRSRAEALQVPGQGLNPYEASVTRQARRDVTNEARNLSPEYDGAVQFQRQAKEQYLNPLREGPTGKLAGTTDVQAQTRALFPAQPAAQSDVGVARAMRGIGRTDPEAAAGVVRQHLESTFNEATQRIQSGQNPFGGAKFSAVVAGNPQQRRNLFAAIRALPNGAVMWRGFNRFLDILEATGKRPAPNSATQFNAQLQKELEQGGLTGEAATIAASPQKAFSYIKDRYAQFRLGRGTEQLARLFTTGNLDDFRRLIKSGPGSPQGVAVMVRFLSQVSASAQGSGALSEINNR